MGNLPHYTLWRARMLRRRCLALTALLLLPAGCSGTLYLTIRGKSPREPKDVLECAKSQIPLLGYNQTSIDVEGHRITARKYDRDARLSDTRFQRMIERLSIEIGKADGGAQLKIGAHTFAELMTQRGPTEVEQDASPGVRAAAQTLLEACSS
jgi:hypothetical protein